MKVSYRGRRQKGANFERRVVREFQDNGIAAEKVPLSGAVKGGKYDHDVSVPVRGVDRKLECKIKANGDGFKKLYGWLEGNYAVCVCMNRADALVVLRLVDFAELAGRPIATEPEALQPQLGYRPWTPADLESIDPQPQKGGR